MENKKEMVLKTVNSENKEDIRIYFDIHGFVATILHLVEHVWDKGTLEKVRSTIENKDQTSEFYHLLFEEFNIQEHFRITDSHRAWVEKSYHRLKTFVPHMNEDDAKKHDFSKYNFVQAIGYTAKWIHNVGWTNVVWQKGLQDHYQRESHHPEFRKGKRMARKDLEESLIDMVACRWERQLGGREDVTNSELVNFESKFLSRYLPEDKDDVEKLIKIIQDADKAPELHYQLSIRSRIAHALLSVA